MDEIKDINISLKSEPMNEMLSNPPRWIVRSGSGLFLIVLFVVVGLAWFIEYPDDIQGEVLITTTKAPIELVNQSYIQLKTLDIRENDEVKQGDLIAQFDILASPQDIDEISKYLGKLEKLQDDFEQLPTYKTPVKLGTLQEAWTKLNYSIRDWNSELKEDISTKEITSIQREIYLREQLQTITENRIRLSADENEMVKSELESSQRLAEKSAISKQLLSTDKRAYTQAQQNVQSQKEEKVQNLIALNTLRSQLTKLKYDSSLKRQQKRTEILIGLASLQNSLNTWEKNAVWVAPCSGRVLFNKMLQVNRFYKANEASIVIVPHGSRYNALATITTDGAGKVKSGQRVFIELLDFQKSEFGVIEGTVSNITQIEKEGKYEVQITLPNQLKTSYGKQIPYRAQFKGKVKIITKNKRLLTRFFEQLMGMWK
jgi:multidrug efflux pump subunit AcrA (membrane-fusion protein)